MSVTIGSITIAVGVCIEQGQSLQAKIQSVGIDIIYWQENNGNAQDQATRLVNGLGKGIKFKALIDWFEANSKLAWDKDETCFVHNKSQKTDIKAAHAVKWYDFKAKSVKKPYDLHDEITKQVKLANKALVKKQSLIDSGDADKIEMAKEIHVDTSKLRLINLLMTDAVSADDILEQFMKTSVKLAS